MRYLITLLLLVGCSSIPQRFHSLEHGTHRLDIAEELGNPTQVVNFDDGNTGYMYRVNDLISSQEFYLLFNPSGSLISKYAQRPTQDPQRVAILTSYASSMNQQESTPLKNQTLANGCPANFVKRSGCEHACVNGQWRSTCKSFVCNGKPTPRAGCEVLACTPDGWEYACQ